MKDVQTGSAIVEVLLKGEIERLKDDLDRLHRERDSFQRQCSVMAEENAIWEAESKRLDWMVKNRGGLNGNLAVTAMSRLCTKTSLKRHWAAMTRGSRLIEQWRCANERE